MGVWKDRILPHVGPRREAGAVRVVRSGLDGQALIEPDESCDSALTTFTLCTIPDPVRALREIRRVLRPYLGRAVPRPA